MRAYCCEQCHKEYRSAHGLWYHKKKCDISEKSPKKSPDHNAVNSDDDIIGQLLKKNDELVNRIVELASIPKTTTTTINSNRHFNLNVFLNQNCKNAMNMKDFVSSLEIEHAELENVGKLGYVQGISNIFIRGLRQLNESERPMHCMDKKRETLYIKDGDVWNKDDSKDKVRQVIGQIAHKNFLKMAEWKHDNPAWEDSDTKKHDQYVGMVKEVFTCITPDDDSGINKIIKRVANEVYINKDAASAGAVGL